MTNAVEETTRKDTEYAGGSVKAESPSKTSDVRKNAENDCPMSTHLGDERAHMNNTLHVADRVVQLHANHAHVRAKKTNNRAKGANEERRIRRQAFAALMTS